MEEVEMFQKTREPFLQIENSIEQKLHESIGKLREDLGNQFQQSDHKNEQLRNSLKEIENIQIDAFRKKEEERLAAQEKTEESLKCLENNVKQNREIFNSFQNLVLTFHQSENKKLEEISSTIANLKIDQIRPKEIIHEEKIDKDLQDKMMDYIDSLEGRLKESPRKIKEPQKSPLKVLLGSKDREWSVGDLESDNDSDEFSISPYDLLSNALL